MSKRKFEDLKTLAGKRVRIAQDALEQLRLKKLISTPGVYFEPVPATDDDDAVFVSSYKSMKRILADSNTKCEVCALGSLMCGLGSANGDLCASNSPRFTLDEYFDDHQMDFIEACYEGDWLCGYAKDGKEESAVKTYKTEYPDPTERLAAILKNIVKNRGSFVP